MPARIDPSAVNDEHRILGAAEAHGVLADPRPFLAAVPGEQEAVGGAHQDRVGGRGVERDLSGGREASVGRGDGGRGEVRERRAEQGRAAEGEGGFMAATSSRGSIGSVAGVPRKQPMEYGYSLLTW